LTELTLHDEKLLFAQIANDDEKAFRQLFDLYRLKVYYFVLRMVKQENVAEEMVQEIFMKIWISRNTLNTVDNPGNYIFMMARNKTVDHLRKIANDTKLRDHVKRQISESQDSAYEQILLKESKQLIQDAVGQLSEQKQLIFKLSRVEGHTIDEIAQQLNISRSTVKNHIVEILKHIRAYLGSHSKTMVIAFMILLSDWI
jgi:RNA polymerase sigma-70 factor (ECF subfamily)